MDRKSPELKYSALAAEIVRRVVEDVVRTQYARQSLGDSPDNPSEDDMVEDALAVAMGEDIGCLDSGEVSAENCDVLFVEQKLEDANQRIAELEADKRRLELVGWCYKVIINKHLTGPPKPGQIQVHGVWGDPYPKLWFLATDPSKSDPVLFVYEKFKVYRFSAEEKSEADQKCTLNDGESEKDSSGATSSGPQSEPSTDGTAGDLINTSQPLYATTGDWLCPWCKREFPTEIDRGRHFEQPCGNTSVGEFNAMPKLPQLQSGIDGRASGEYVFDYEIERVKP